MGLQDVPPEMTARDMARLPIPADLVFNGKRDIHNSGRSYFTADAANSMSEIRSVMEGFQSSDTVRTIEALCGISLRGSSLRIEFAQDVDGFWFMPHTDLGLKLFTMLIFLCGLPGQGDLGTNLHDGDLRHSARAPSEFGAALVFIPDKNTSHGFEKRPIRGVRRSLIVIYVTSEWRARHELAYPMQPVG
jgi:hypothetical protein